MRTIEKAFKLAQHHFDLAEDTCVSDPKASKLHSNAADLYDIAHMHHTAGNVKHAKVAFDKAKDYVDKIFQKNIW